MLFADLGLPQGRDFLKHKILQTEVFVARMQCHWDCANFLQLQKGCTLSRLQSTHTTTHSQTQKLHNATPLEVNTQNTYTRLPRQTRTQTH